MTDGKGVVYAATIGLCVYIGFTSFSLESRKARPERLQNASRTPPKRLQNASERKKKRL